MNKKFIIVLSALFALSCFAQEVSQQDIQRYSAYYSNGMQYLKNGQFSSAVIEFKKVLRFSPYDTTIQEALANAYYARAQYFRQTTKEVKKALVDYKSAYFYAKYWSKANPSNTMLTLANDSRRNAIDLEKRLQSAQTPQNRAHEAKILKAQGELAASAYDYQELKNTTYKEEAYENLGNIYKNLNNLSQAMEYLQEAIAINPTNPKLHFSYGVILDEAKNYEASMEQYNLALQYGDKSPELLEILENKWTHNIVNNPSDAQSYINLGAIYQKQGNLEAAKSQYLKAYNLDSSDETSLYNLASLYTQQKDYINAIGVYDKLLAKKPNNIEVLEYKANAYCEISKFDEAIKQYETILAIQPNNQNAKNNIENIVANHFSGAKLQNYLMLKANSNPASYEAQFNYALELHKNKNLDSALIYYKKALNIDPSKEETYINLAQIYIDKKDYKSATDICQKGLMILPNSKSLNQYLADIKNYGASEKYDLATKLFNEKQYQKALNQYMQIQDKTPEVNMAIASCYWQMNDFKNANKYYLDILTSDPNNQDALINSAYAYNSLNDLNNAKIQANKLLALNPNNQDAINLIKGIEDSETSNAINDVIAKYEAGDYNTSLNLANKYLTKKPDDEYGLYYKALNLDELKKTNDAQKIYKQLITKHPDFAPAYYSCAVNLDNAQKYDEALKNYEKFLSLKNNEKDEMTEFSSSRIKELKDYLEQLNASK